MTDEEIVVQAIQKTMGQTTRETLWIERDAARAVVAALREAGRLVPEGCVAVDRERWGRVRSSAWAMQADDDISDDVLGLHPGDLEPLS